MKTLIQISFIITFTFSAKAQPGSLDLSFGTAGIVTTPIGTSNERARGIALQSDGKIMAVGYVYNGANDDFAIARYDTNGTLDNTFDIDGKIITPIGTGNDAAHAVAIQSDGKILVGGYTALGGGISEFALLRYNTNGSLDSTFDTDGIVTTSLGTTSTEIHSIAIQPDGRIIVAGSAATGFNSDFALARYLTNGSLDISFDSDGKVITPVGTASDIIWSMALQTNGKIVVAGSSNNGTNSDFALARYDTSGALDVSFDNDGKLTTAISSSHEGANSVVIQQDGKIVVAGYTTGASNVDFAIARYDSSGVPDISFDSDGIAITPVSSMADEANAVTIQPDGKILAAGYSWNGSWNDFALVRYDTNGSADNSFDTDGIVTTSPGSQSDYIYCMLLQPDGKIVVAGRSDNGSDYDFALARYLSGINAGMSEYNNVTRFNIYPNPVNSDLVITCTESMNEISIYDVTGKKIYNTVPSTTISEFHINTVDFRAGIYTIQMRTKGNIATRKLIRL